MSFSDSLGEREKKGGWGGLCRLDLMGAQTRDREIANEQASKRYIGKKKSKERKGTSIIEHLGHHKNS